MCLSPLVTLASHHRDDVFFLKDIFKPKLASKMSLLYHFKYWGNGINVSVPS